MRTSSFSKPANGSVQYPNNIVFMYSRQPIIITCDSGVSASVTMTCVTNGNATHTESRRFYAGAAEFDISRIMQALSRDADEVLQRVDYTNSASLSEVFSIQVTVDGTTVLNLAEDIQALYGALDATEVYGRRLTRKIFLNYPQTLNMWKDILGNYTATFADVPCELNYGSDKGRSREESVQDMLGGAVLAKLRNGVDVIGRTSWLYRIQEGVQTAQATREVILRGDDTPRGHGAYLRWLNRQGEVSYWLFEKTQLETTGAVAESFSRFYSGDPAEPVDSVFRNPDKRNYNETRRLALSAANLSEEDFDNLCSLLTSPVVEMLYEAEEYTGLGFVVDGGTAAAAGTGLIDGADAATNLAGLDGGEAQETTLHYSAADRWIRVNVEGGTQSKNTRYTAPRLHKFDTVIALIERNNARL